MSARDALDDLIDFVDRDPQLEVATVARAPADSAPPEGRVLALAGDAEGFFRDTIRAAVTDRVPEWSLRKLDPVYKPDTGTVEWADATSVDAVEFARSRFSNLSPLAPFRPGDAEYKKRLVYWVCVLSTGAKKAFFFRAFSAAAELERKRGIALVSKDGTFHRVEEEIFLFDDRIDCVVYGDYLYVLRKNDFRRIFDQLEQVRRAARLAARRLHQQIPIANFDEFEAACAGQAGMADKLIAVTARDYFTTLTIARLKPVIDEFHLAIPMTSDGGQEQLVFQTDPERRWRILKLVDDDYLRSSLTDHRYEVNSKTEPPA